MLMLLGIKDAPLPFVESAFLLLESSAQVGIIHPLLIKFLERYLSCFVDCINNPHQPITFAFLGKSVALGQKSCMLRHRW